LNWEGSIYGWTYDIYRSHMAYKFARFRTPIRNLFNAGHYAMWPGGVIFSALSGGSWPKASIVASGGSFYFDMCDLEVCLWKGLNEYLM